jgi:hypothetical protein
VVQRYEIRSVQPLQVSSYLDPIVNDQGQLRLFLDEMNSNLHDHPSSFRSHFILGMLAVKRGPNFWVRRSGNSRSMANVAAPRAVREVVRYRAGQGVLVSVPPSQSSRERSVLA